MAVEIDHVDLMELNCRAQKNQHSSDENEDAPTTEHRTIFKNSILANNSVEFSDITNDGRVEYMGEDGEDVSRDGVSDEESIDDAITPSDPASQVNYTYH